ncbi:MAG: hypothetical protein OEW29_01465 [Acidimicrobiia bacterium]|nr:hypothetical protein [Acidimicrobiia bacterium]
MRTPVTLTARARLVLSALAVAFAACGSIPEPTSFQPTTSTGVDRAATVSPGGQGAAAAAPAGPVAVDPAAAAGFEPFLPDGYVAQALVATNQGVFVGDTATLLALPAPLVTFHATRVAVYLRQARDGGTATPELTELTGEGRTSVLPLPPAAAVGSVSFARRSLTADGP